MTIDALIMLLGFLVAIEPFLGFTVAMDTRILFVIGICIIAAGIVVRRRISHSAEQKSIQFIDAPERERMQ